MGNICRSPTAEGVFRALAQEHYPDLELSIDSCGTIGYHVGERADPRSVDAAKNRGYDLSSIRSRKIKSSDLDDFDLILVMDKANLVNVQFIDVEYNNSHKIKLFLDYLTDKQIEEVPDPYYGGTDGFDRVIDLIELASYKLLEKINAKTN